MLEARCQTLLLELPPQNALAGRITRCRPPQTLCSFLTLASLLQQYCLIEGEAPRETERDGTVGADFPKGEISFRGVEMRYREGLPLVLKGLNLNIPAGARVGVVGRTGAGKSSLMVALMRLVECSGGSICIDGVDIKGLGLAFLRKKIAIVPQDPVLFSGTVRSNLDPFDEHADKRLEDVLRRVGLLGRGGRVGGLGDTVEEEGANFSVGQRQLLVIGRALLGRCSIILMDEATASIDVETDKVSGAGGARESALI